MRPLLSAGLLLVLFNCVGSSLAQDAHFWDSQYGTRAQLLGGLVVGSPSDLSSTFYNPAWLALDQQPGVLLTTKAFETYQVKMKNGFGPGTEPTSTHVTPSPGFFAGSFRHALDEDDITVAYSYLQRVKFEYDASGVRVQEDPAPPPEGNIWFSAEAYNRTSTSEHWAGVTFAKRLGEHTLVGLTPFGALRNQSFRTQVHAKGMDSDSNFAHVYDMSYASFWHTRLLVKAGLALDYSPWTFGMTLTTPSLGLFGNGTVHTDASLSGVDGIPPEGTDTYLAVNYQPDQSTTFKSPLSIALGAAFQAGNTSYYMSAEWFNGLDSYQIMTPDSYASQSHPERILDFKVSYSSRSVINWGLAASHQFNQKFSLYGSFRSDRSIVDNESDPTMMLALWDLWHLTSGASFEFLDIEFTAGLGYSRGEAKTTRFRSFSFEDQPAVVGDYPETEITFNRLKFLIGFNLPFNTQ